MNFLSEELYFRSLWVHTSTNGLLCYHAHDHTRSLGSCNYVVENYIQHWHHNKVTTKVYFTSTNKEFQ